MWNTKRRKSCVNKNRGMKGSLLLVVAAILVVIFVNIPEEKNVCQLIVRIIAARKVYIAQNISRNLKNIGARLMVMRVARLPILQMLYSVRGSIHPRSHNMSLGINNGNELERSYKKLCGYFK